MIEYMIYLIVLVIGLILGLLYSYKKHGEPYVVKGLEAPTLVISIVGWVLVFNFFSSMVLLCALGLFLVGFVIGERPGYGRGETAIGFVLGIVSYFMVQILLMVV